MAQAGIRGASASWVHRRWPDAARPQRPGPLLMLKGIVVSPLMLLAGQGERAGLRLLDVAIQLAEWRGTLRDNRARERPGAPEPDVEIWCAEFPERDDDRVAADARRHMEAGRAVAVLAGRRPIKPAVGAHALRVRYLEDD